MANCYVWTFIGDLNLNKLKDALDYFGFKVDAGMQENPERLKLTITKLNDTEPSASEKTSIKTAASSVSILLEWV